MANIELVIKIPEEVVTAIQNGEDYRYDIHTAIANGTPLPKGHGRLIDADKLKTHFVGTEQGTDLEVYLEPTIIYAPTIIEADKTESEEAVEIIDGVLFVHTRHYDDVNRVIICHQKKPYRVFSDDEKDVKRMNRERAIQILKMNEQEKWRSGITSEEEKEAVDMAIEALKEQRPHGEWRECEVKNIFGEKMKVYECSNCKRKNIGDIWIMCKLSFCPHCGADMRKEGEEK